MNLYHILSVKTLLLFIFLNFFCTLFSNFIYFLFYIAVNTKHTYLHLFEKNKSEEKILSFKRENKTENQ